MLFSGAFWADCSEYHVSAQSCEILTNLQIFLQTGKVKPDSLLVKVAILLDFQSRITENGSVVPP